MYFSLSRNALCTLARARRWSRSMTLHVHCLNLPDRDHFLIFARPRPRSRPPTLISLCFTRTHAESSDTKHQQRAAQELAHLCRGAEGACRQCGTEVKTRDDMGLFFTVFVCGRNMWKFSLPPPIVNTQSLTFTRPLLFSLSLSLALLPRWPAPTNSFPF